MLSLTISLKLNVGFRSGAFELSHDLGTERAHAKRRLNATLSQTKRLGIEHPFIRRKRIVLAVNDKSEVTEVVLALALYQVGRSRKTGFLECFGGEARHRHERGTRVERDEAALWSICANVLRLAIHLDIIKLNTKHVLELDIVPVNIARELGLIIVAESQVRFLTLSFILGRSKIECEHIAFEQVLFHHLVEDRCNSRLGKSGISKTND